jgi:hypothetical protein
MSWREKVNAMYPEFMNDMLEDRLKTRQDVMYKVLDKDDRVNQGLYKMSHTYYLDKRGMGVILKHKVEIGDIFLVDIFIEEENELIKACCEVASCDIREDESYRVRLDFIIIKDSYRQYWEEFLSRKIEEEVV